LSVLGWTEGLEDRYVASGRARGPGVLVRRAHGRAGGGRISVTTFLERNTYLEQMEDERTDALAEVDRLRRRLDEAERKLAEHRREALRRPRPHWPTGRPRGVPFCERCRGPADERLVVGPGIELDRRAPSLLVGGEPVRLSPAEYRFLETLACRPGEPFGHAELVAAMWDRPMRNRPADAHVLRINAYRLRCRLAGTPLRVETLHGVGYRLVVERGAERATA
jgi:hypothetical protein